MIEKYFGDVIEQVYNQIGKSEKNIVLASYNNDFSVADCAQIKRYSANQDDVFFASFEFEYDTIVEAYAPFLNVICQMYKTYVNKDFNQFMDQCNVYSLHREVIYSYYTDGNCKRAEDVILNEVNYEQLRMTEGIGNMLIALSELKPILIVINRYNLAAKSSIDLILYILEHGAKNIGIVLGANEVKSEYANIAECWNDFTEIIKDNNQMFHLGNTGKKRSEKSIRLKERVGHFTDLYHKLCNSFYLMDYEYIDEYLRALDRQYNEERPEVDPAWLRQIYILYIRTNIYLERIYKSLEVLSRLSHLNIPGQEQELEYECTYYRTMCYMYQDKLTEGMELAGKCRRLADQIGDQKKQFKSQLLFAQVQMSGWHNIFFCVNDVVIEESLIESLMKYNYINYLAHIYIYAYDNGADIIAKAYRSEHMLINFSKGVELAKKIGNENLVCDAYQKNIMIASTNGMNEIAMLYAVRTFEFIRKTDRLNVARTLVSVGYNLSAIGHNEQATNYYNRGKEIFFSLKRVEDVAEVDYNMAINDIMYGNYARAQASLERVMKTIESLHLNSLRVCNLSKLYALLALTNIIQNKRFGCERNLKNCKLFLNYILEKSAQEHAIGIIHDYTRCEDDLFLCNFGTALLHVYSQEYEEAFSDYETAEKYLSKAEGNQFYVIKLFRESRMKLFEILDKKELYEKEKNSLLQQQKIFENLRDYADLSILTAMEGEYRTGECEVSKEMQDQLVKQIAAESNYLTSRMQLDFFGTWQNIIDYAEVSEKKLADEAMMAFINNFNNDRALFVRFEEEDQVNILFDNTGIAFTDQTLKEMANFVKMYPNGFSASKIDENFMEHLETIAYFGEDDVCSFVAVPCYTKGKVQAIVFSYVLMKDNWHNSINRYMLNEDDLNIYRILFRELNNEINRIQANNKIQEMNKILEKTAITDALTGVYNRNGMYSIIEKTEQKVMEKKTKDIGVALMFLDLDNFKPYNDTYGHDVGDMVLQEFAKLLQEISKELGFVSRYGGDEFIVFLNTDNREQLEKIAGDIISRIENSEGFKQIIESRLGRKLPDVKNTLTCSIGISVQSNYEEHGIYQMIKQADDLMYSVKTGKKGTYAFL